MATVTGIEMFGVAILATAVSAGTTCRKDASEMITATRIGRLGGWNPRDR